MYVTKSYFWMCTGSLGWKEIANICTKWEKVKKKKSGAWKEVGFLFILPLEGSQVFWSYVLQESVAVNFDVPSSVVRA